MEICSKFNKRRAFNKVVGPGKNPKLISIGPTFIPDYRVVRFQEGAGESEGKNIGK